MTDFNLPKGRIDATGIHLPTFNELRDAMVAGVQGIYGSDIYLGNDSQDGELITLVTQAAVDCYALAAMVYAGFDPSAAAGVPLSRVVQINGIDRKVPTRSTVLMKLIGQAGTTIQNGAVEDDLGSTFLLPASVEIPYGGEVVVTATCTKLGAVRARAGTVTTMATPTAGWQSCVNVADATVGAPLESDAELRLRQKDSTMIPATSPYEALVGALKDLVGVTDLKVYENDTDLPNEYGIPAHSIAAVVQGGDAQAIADVISRTKTQGVSTYGRSMVLSSNTAGVPDRIYFSSRVDVPVLVIVRLNALEGYTSDVEAVIKARVIDWINALPLGKTVGRRFLFMPAQLNAEAPSETFRLLDVLIARTGNVPSVVDLPMAYYEKPSCALENVSVVVVPS